MKDIFVIVIILAILITVFYLVKSNSDKKDDKISLKKNNPGSECDDKKQPERYTSLIDSLQCDYRLGVPNGTYIPVPIDRQPIDALPFNPGLKPCEFRLV